MAESRIRLQKYKHHEVWTIPRNMSQLFLLSISLYSVSLSLNKDLRAENVTTVSLVQQLNSQSFTQRIAAQRALQKIAPHDLAKIEELALGESPETAQRLVEVLETIFLQNDDELGEAAEKTLQRLTRAGGAASVSAGLVLQGNSYLRESRARIALEKLGAQFVYYRPDAHFQGNALFGRELAILPEYGVGFGPSAHLHSVYLHENWTGTKDDLWHLTRLDHHEDLTIYSIRGNSIDINELFLLSRFIRGLSIQQRGACLGIRSKPFTSGCVVGTVVEGAAADKGGLLTNDQVLKIDEIFIRNFQHLVQSLQDYSIGDEVTFTILRDGLQMELIVTLGSWRDVSKTNNDPMVVEPPPHFQGPFGKKQIQEDLQKTNKTE